MSDKKKLKLKIHFDKASAILIAVFAVLLAADLILKFWYEEYDWNFTVIPKLIWVENNPANNNYGAAFSFLSNTEWGRIFFIVLTFIMLAVMIAAFLLLPEKFVGFKVALAMIAAGALGNLVDRLAFGYVRDFVWVNIFGKWACCNFADFWIVFGVIWAIIDILFLNEWAVFPLTKKARAAAKQRELAEKAKSGQTELQKSDDGNGQEPPETDGDEKREPPEEPTDGADGEE